MSKSTTRRAAAVDSSLQRLHERHRALLGELRDIGLVLRGSIARRPARCGQPGCRCKAEPPVLHGPYYVWTRKVAGKTITAQLTPEQASQCQAWNHNMHKLDRIVRQMQALGLRAATRLRGRGRLRDTLGR